jgi:hypothetical protein
MDVNTWAVEATDDPTATDTLHQQTMLQIYLIKAGDDINHPFQTIIDSNSSIGGTNSQDEYQSGSFYFVVYAENVNWTLKVYPNK